MAQLYNHPINRLLRTLLLQCVLLLGIVTAGLAQATTAVNYNGPWRTSTSGNITSSGLSVDGADLAPSTAGGSAQLRTTSAYVNVKIQEDGVVGLTGYKVRYSLKATTTRADYSANVRVSYRLENGSDYREAVIKSVTTQVQRDSVALPSNATDVRFELESVNNAYVFLDAITVSQEPEAISFNPAQGVPGTDVTVTGIRLTEATEVLFGDVSAVATVVDSTTVTVKVPFGAKSALLKVQTPYGAATSATEFIVPAPAFAAGTEFSPASAGMGEEIILYGDYFTGVSEVLFNGVAATAFTVDSDNQITATVPVGASTGLITVRSAAGEDVSATAFTVLGPQIVATDVDGASVEFSPATGAVGTTVTIYGDYFTGVSEVLFNGVAATAFTVDSDNQITATVPVGASTGLITVRSAAGEDVSATAFDVPAPQFVVFDGTDSQFKPTSAGPGMQVTLYGLNLSGVSSVVFLGNDGAEDDREGTIVTPVTSDTELTVTVPNDASTGRIRITAPGVGKEATSEQIFTFVPAPVIASVATTAGGLSYGKLGEEITITGESFETATEVVLGSSIVTPYDEANNSTGFVVGPDGTTITFKIPQGATSGSVTVTTLGGEATWEGPFDVVLAPVYTSLTPVKGPIGQEITIVGQYLKYVSEVNFLGAEGTTGDEQQVTEFISATDSELKLLVPQNAVTGKLSITNPAGSTITTDEYEVVVVPVIQAFTPTAGVAGDVVTITGYNFTGATAVTFGASGDVTAYDETTNPAGFNIISDTELTVTVPSDATTGLIYVTNSRGTGSSTTEFTVVQKPTITSISPLKGVAGEKVVITGTEFIGEGVVVTFLGAEGTEDDIIATTLTVDSQTQITATVPTGAVTGQLMVTNAAGNSEPSAQTYEVVTTPEIISFNPTSGKVGDQVKITGWLLDDVSEVGFNGVLAVPTFNSADSSLSVAVPDGATTGPLSLVVDGATVFTTTDIFTVVPAPTIVSFDPMQGLAGTVVTITGTNFINVSGVSFNGVAADISTMLVNETFDELTVTVPYAATTGKIKVTAEAGEAESVEEFTVPVPANITFTNYTATPTESYAYQLVTVRGQYFNNATGVAFNGKAATVVTGVEDELDGSDQPTGYQLITVKAPFDAGTGKVAVTTPAGTGTSAEDYKVIEPVISTISSTEGYVEKTVLTISGTFFTQYWDETLNAVAEKAPVVKFNGAQVTASTYTDTEITVTVPDGARSGSLTVMSGSGESEQMAFSVLAPVLSNVQPAAVYAGESVTVTGTNFINVTSVSFGGIQISDYTVNLTNEEIGDGSITFTAPVVNHNTPNVLSVTSMSGTGSTNALTVYKPVISSITETGKTNDTRVYAGVNTVTITGSRFDEYYNGTAVDKAVPTVTFAGANSTRVQATIASATYSSDEAGTDVLVVNVPATAVTGRVQVTSNSGTGQYTSNLTIIGTPTITGFSTYAGIEGSTFTINGSNFDDATKVTFLGIDGEADEVDASFSITSSTAISVTVPVGATIGRIAVSTPFNDGTTVESTQIFRVVKAPVIRDFTMKEGPVGYEVTITGESLIDVNGMAKVYFRGHDGAEIPAPFASQIELAATVSSEDLTTAREIKAIVPENAITGIIRVENVVGTVTTAAATETSVDEFVVTSPVIVRFEDLSGNVIDGANPARIKETVLIRGYQLKELGTVKVAGINANFYERATDPTTVEMLVPVGATTNAVTITTAEGTETSDPDKLTIASPVIAVNPAALSFVVNPGEVSETKSYTVSAQNLAVGENLYIQIPGKDLTDFKVSMDGVTWGTTVPALLPDADGNVSETAIYVRNEMRLDALTEQTGNVENRSIGAPTAVVSLSTAFSPLPVELMSFKGAVQGGNVLLTWMTASEQNNSHFEVEMSMNAKSGYEKVGRVDSKVTNSSIRTSYEFVHKLGASGTRYYRLKQVDLDGTTDYSNVVAVTIKAPEQVKMLVSPNPIVYNSKLIITADVSGKAALKLHSITGKRMYAKEVVLEQGENTLQLPVYEKLSTGMYILTMELNGQTYQVKVVKE